MWTVPQYPFNLLRGPKDAVMHDKDGKPITDAQWLKNEIERIQPLLIVIDTLRDLHEEDEDKSGPMRKVLGTLTGIAGPKVSILLISHSRKDSMFTSNSEDDIMQAGRGSNAVPGKMDMVIRMTKKEIHTKGRAVGYKKYNYIQTEPDGWLVIDHAEKEEKKNDLYDTIAMLSDNNPGITKNQLAAKLAAITKQSERTAHRRIDEWIQHQQAKQAARQRLQDSQPQASLVVTPQGTHLNLETGEEMPILPPLPQDQFNLWNQPMT
jgi:hypothetical protein